VTLDIKSLYHSVTILLLTKTFWAHYRDGKAEEMGKKVIYKIEYKNRKQFLLAGSS
jgi:hypothetical protein